MSLGKIFAVAGSALQAQSMRLNTTASNLANAESVSGPDGAVYKPRHVVFESAPVGPHAAGQAGAATGVRVQGVIEDTAEPRRLFNPGHPNADELGFVTMPAVNVVEEMVNMISASRAYQNNVEILATTRSLLEKTLQLGN